MFVFSWRGSFIFSCGSLCVPIHFVIRAASDENLSLWFSTRSNTGHERWLETCNFGHIKEEERLYYLCSKNNGADQLCELICTFAFAYMQKAGFLTTRLILSY